MDSKEDRVEGDRGAFFAVDRNAWGRVCSLGINPAVAYLVLARGTLRDNRTTSWSTNALESYTGISRPRAKKAIQDLIVRRFIEQKRGGSKPKYHIVAADEIDGPIKPRPVLSEDEESVLAVISQNPDGIPVPKARREGDPWSVVNPHSVAIRLQDKGLARRKRYPTTHFAPVPQVERAKPDWIWLPNAIIDGAADEIPPVELIRQAHNLAAMRLYIDLYHAQALAIEGGIHWQEVRLDFDRYLVGERGEFTVWGFIKGTMSAFGTPVFVEPHLTGSKSDRILQTDGSYKARDPGWQTFWDAFSVLRDLHLVGIVPHVVDKDSDDGEVMYPYGISRDAEAVEIRIARAAIEAGRALLNDKQRDAAEASDCWLLPAPKHMKEVQLVGLVRLRYRARTRATAQWAAKALEWEAAAEKFNLIAQKAVDSQSDATSKEYQ